MFIDPEAEALGRAATRWAMAQEEERFLSALDEIAEAEESLRDTVLGLYLGVGALAVRYIHHNQRPSQEQNRALAEKIIQATPWEPVTADDIYRYLEIITDPEDHAAMSGPGGLMVVFMVVGYVLAWYYDGLGYQNAYQFLDHILNHMAQMPNPDTL